MTFDILLDHAQKLLKGVDAIKVEFAKRAIEYELARRSDVDAGKPEEARLWAVKGEELRQALLVVEKYFPTKA